MKNLVDTHQIHLPADPLFHSHDHEFLEARRVELEVYLQALYMTLGPFLYPDFNAFLMWDINVDEAIAEATDIYQAHQLAQMQSPQPVMPLPMPVQVSMQMGALTPPPMYNSGGVTPPLYSSGGVVQGPPMFVPGQGQFNPIQGQAPLQAPVPVQGQPGVLNGSAGVVLNNPPVNYPVTIQPPN